MISRERATVMKRIPFFALAAAAMMSLTGCQHSSAVKDAGEDLQEAVSNQERAALLDQLTDIFNDDRFERAFWGVKVKSLDSGEVWYERNAEKLFMPASNEKIPTTAAALTYLGPDFQFETHVRHSGEVQDGVLDGDIVVRADGDPTIYTRFYDSPTELFDRWAENLKRMGVTRIDGDIIGDDNAWADNHVHWSWPQNLSAWYYAEFGPLTLNENYVDFNVIAPENPGEPVILEPNLPSNYYTVINNLEAVEADRSSFSFSRERDSNVITFSGTVAAGASTVERTPTITNPTLFYVTVLKETFEKHGIEVGGDPIDIDDLEDAEARTSNLKLLGTAKSPKLSEILTGLMKRSQNMYAETMVHVLGEKEKGLGSYSNGVEVLEDQLEMMGVADNSYIFRDGSGLSRYNYVSPEMITQINEWMHGNPDYWEVWYDTFPIAGVDGTLRNRMKGTAAEGNARGKTGLIANTRALSGYVTTASGELLAYSFIVNSHTRSSSDADDVINRGVVALAEYTGD